MTASSTSSPRYDEIRAQNPDLVVNLYGMTPGGPVVLELIAPDGFTATYRGETAEAAIAQAFPQPAADAPAPAEPTPSIFD